MGGVSQPSVSAEVLTFDITLVWRASAHQGGEMMLSAALEGQRQQGSKVSMTPDDGEA